MVDNKYEIKCKHKCNNNVINKIYKVRCILVAVAAYEKSRWTSVN